MRLIGIGLEDVGLEEFQQGQFFSGELFIDTKKETYKLMGFRRLNFFSIFPAIFSKNSRAAYNKAKEDKLGGDLKGDGMQNGGALVIEKGGKTLLSFKQESPSDHVENAEVLKALGIEGPPPQSPPEGAAAAAAATATPAPTCEGDVCQMPKKE